MDDIEQALGDYGRSRERTAQQAMLDLMALGCQTIALPPIDEQRRIGATMNAIGDQVAAFTALAEASGRVHAALSNALVAGVVGLNDPFTPGSPT
ncbi:hypothetical protein ACQP0C_07205 [Nocardia sp. CA-129566]|uniref:hypothetical protein n=1 Tax=Nocardia sp. CA-129566 TaxID=3239976 RepID=UPI003D96DF25